MDEEIDLEVEDFESEEAPVEEVDTEEEDMTDWKSEAEKWKGVAKRYKTKLEKTPQPEPAKEAPKQNDLDYGQLAYLESKGYESDDEITFIKGIMDKTGMSLKEAVKDDYVKNRIKGMREDKAVKEATPSNTKRKSPSGKDSVDYWIAKGELPADTMLAREVLNKRIEIEKQKSKFSDNPVVAR